MWTTPINILLGVESPTPGETKIGGQKIPFNKKTDTSRKELVNTNLSEAWRDKYPYPLLNFVLFSNIYIYIPDPRVEFLTFLVGSRKNIPSDLWRIWHVEQYTTTHSSKKWEFGPLQEWGFQLFSWIFAKSEKQFAITFFQKGK